MDNTHFELVAGVQVHELMCDVRAAVGVVSVLVDGSVILPVPVGHLGEHASRRRVGDARRRHDACRRMFFILTVIHIILRYYNNYYC